VRRIPDVVDNYGFGLLFERPINVDADALLVRLRQEMRVDLVSKSDDVIQLAHPDHLVSVGDRKIPTFINIIRWAKPIGPADFKSALEQTFDWAEAEDTVARCRHKILVADLTGGGLPYQQRYELIGAVVRAVSEVTKPSAIQWEAADCIVQPERLARRLSFYCNVRLFEITKPKGNRLMDTMGLAALGLVDAQCLFRELDASEVARWLYSVARQIYANGDFIKDGQTIPGINSTEYWVCRHVRSMAPPHRPGVDVTPAPPFAGKR